MTLPTLETDIELLYGTGAYSAQVNAIAVDCLTRADCGDLFPNPQANLQVMSFSRPALFSELRIS